MLNTLPLFSTPTDSYRFFSALTSSTADLRSSSLRKTWTFEFIVVPRSRRMWAIRSLLRGAVQHGCE